MNIYYKDKLLMYKRLFSRNLKYHNITQRKALQHKLYKIIPKWFIKWLVQDELNKWGGWDNKSTLAQLYISEHPEFYSLGDEDLDKDYSYRVRIVSEDRQARENVQKKLAYRRANKLPPDTYQVKE